MDVNLIKRSEQIAHSMEDTVIERREYTPEDVAELRQVLILVTNHLVFMTNQNERLESILAHISEMSKQTK